MRNLAINIPVTLNINNITKWEVEQFVDCKDDETPYASIVINAYGAGNILYGTYQLIARDLTPSQVLVVNPAPTRFYEQLIEGQKLCTGAYTAITTVYYNGSFNKRQRLDALEAVLLSSGIMANALF